MNSIYTMKTAHYQVSQHSDQSPSFAQPQPIALTSVAAAEALQLSCSSEACHINRSEFELVSVGEAEVLTFAVGTH
ncbi:MAG: hypothetical protein ACI9R3_001558 [Verrucomicrobiales bacterium]|jgi:hypothetical protein